MQKAANIADISVLIFSHANKQEQELCWTSILQQQINGFTSSFNNIQHNNMFVTSRPLRYTGKYRYTGIRLKYRYRDFWKLNTGIACVSSNCLPEKMQSHIGYICLTFPHCVFSNVSSNCLPERMQSRIGCIWLTFPHCAFSNVSSNGLPEKRHNHIGCICLTFHYYAFWNVSSNLLHKGMHSHTDIICLTLIHCVFSNVSSKCLFKKMHSHTHWLQLFDFSSYSLIFTCAWWGGDNLESLCK